MATPDTSTTLTDAAIGAAWHDFLAVKPTRWSCARDSAPPLWFVALAISIANRVHCQRHHTPDAASQSVPYTRAEYMSQFLQVYVQCLSAAATTCGAGATPDEVRVTAIKMADSAIKDAHIYLTGGYWQAAELDMETFLVARANAGGQLRERLGV